MSAPPLPKKACIYTPDVHDAYDQSPLTVSLLTKIVDPSVEFSLKVLIFVPTRSFGMPCCPPPFTKAGDINYTRHCAIRLFNAKAGELFVTFVKDQHMDVVTGSFRRDTGLNNL